jgi:hypothetical protein
MEEIIHNYLINNKNTNMKYILSKEMNIPEDYLPFSKEIDEILAVNLLHDIKGMY